MTRREMLDRMDSRELSEWIAYNSLQPIGPQRDDLGSGIIAATIANCHRDPKKRSTPYEPSDFAPFLRDGGDEKQKQTKQEVIAGARQLFSMVKTIARDQEKARKVAASGNRSEPARQRAGEDKIVRSKDEPNAEVSSEDA